MPNSQTLPESAAQRDAMNAHKARYAQQCLQTTPASSAQQAPAVKAHQNGQPLPPITAINQSTHRRNGGTKSGHLLKKRGVPLAGTGRKSSTLTTVPRLTLGNHVFHEVRGVRVGVLYHEVESQGVHQLILGFQQAFPIHHVLLGKQTLRACMYNISVSNGQAKECPNGPKIVGKRRERASERVRARSSKQRPPQKKKGEIKQTYTR